MDPAMMEQAMQGMQGGDPSQMQQPQQLSGELGQSQNQMFLGGVLGALGSAGGGASGLVGNLAGLAGNLIGGNKPGNAPSGGASALSGALSGASSGASLGPIGAIGGALIGGVKGLFDGRAARKKFLDAKEVEAQSARNKSLNTYDVGGYMGSDTLRPKAQALNLAPIGVQEGPGLPTELPNVKAINHKESRSFMDKAKSSINDIGNVIGDYGSKAGDFLNKNGANIARYAPAAIDALQLANLERPDVTSLDRLDSRYKPNYTDEQQIQNKVREQFNTTNEALAGASGGSTSALRSNILASGLNRSKAISNAYQQASNANRSEDRAAQQFNMGVDKTNLSQSNLEKDIRARDEGAYETEKSKAYARLGDNLGNIGKEALDRKNIGKITGYDKDGNPIYRNRPVVRDKGTPKAIPGTANTPLVTPEQSSEIGNAAISKIKKPTVAKTGTKKTNSKKTNSKKTSRTKTPKGTLRPGMGVLKPSKPAVSDPLGFINNPYLKR
jgi:hypothetical protein